MSTCGAARSAQRNGAQKGTNPHSSKVNPSFFVLNMICHVFCLFHTKDKLHA
jgi:hypothetical protein